MREIWKPLSAVVFSAIVAGAITGFPGVDTAKASNAARVAKAPVSTADTSDRGWPYNGKVVRIVTTDRVR